MHSQSNHVLKENMTFLKRQTVFSLLYTTTKNTPYFCSNNEFSIHSYIITLFPSTPHPYLILQIELHSIYNHPQLLPNTFLSHTLQVYHNQLQLIQTSSFLQKRKQGSETVQ